MLRGRIDPELIAGLDALLAATGPNGLAGIGDPVARRAAFLELMEAGTAEPDDDKHTCLSQSAACFL